MANTIQTTPQAKWIFNWQGPSGTGPGIAGAVQFTPTELPHGSGWKSNVLDLGVGPRTTLFEWRAKTTVGTGSPTVGGTVDLYLLTSDDNTMWDGNLGSGNYVVTEPNKRRNAQFIGSVSVDESSTGFTSYFNSGFCEIYGRYVSVMWFNFSGISFTGTASDQYFQLIPVPEQII